MAHQDAAQNLSDLSQSLIARGYSITRKLGEGTYAKVYLATYTNPNDPSSSKISLACKIVNTTKAPKDFVRKFLPRELEVLMKISHPHIVHVHAIYQSKSRILIFMRLAENGDLLEWVLKHGPVGENQCRVWLRQLALAVQYLQALDLAHRDLKCENILITSHCNCKLADFGFARSVVDNRGRRILCATNCGSLAYAAPEILSGNPYDPRISDIWSLGVVLFIMLNKAMPFNDDNIQRMYREQIQKQWRFAVRLTFSEEVKLLVQNMLEPDTQRRYIVGQVLASEWIAMDPRLATKSQAEERAIGKAMRDRELRHAQQEGLRPAEQGPTINITPGAAVSGVGEVEEEDIFPILTHDWSTDTNIWSAYPEGPDDPDGAPSWDERRRGSEEVTEASEYYSNDILGYADRDSIRQRETVTPSASGGSVPGDLGTE